MQRTETVTGEMWGEPLYMGEDVVVHSVVFTPGSRTHWHRHEGLQVLLVTCGVGFVQTASGETAEVATGDIVYCPPGEEHWHGAAQNSLMQHTTFTLGKTDWFKPVDDEQYVEAHRAGHGASKSVRGS
ncbi:cupin domain-containing protein [Nocardioides sp.]|uniref:cupin domain-containing protein n=1 Tax=Nocardioides sp. TaxID=35761 RepID=UPI003D102B51